VSRGKANIVPITSMTNAPNIVRKNRTMMAGF
jgi:hypothetical protein